MTSCHYRRNGWAARTGCLNSELGTRNSDSPTREILTPQLPHALPRLPKGMPDRRYDQNELAAIFRAAAEAQAKDTTESGSDGLTISEIERVASEVGIDPKYIASAAETLEKSPSKKGFMLGGSPSRRVIVKDFDGELDDAAWEEIVGEMREAIGATGTPSIMGKSREWTGGTDVKNAHLSATPKNGRTRFRLTLEYQGVILAWLGLITSSFLGTILSGAFTYKAGGPWFVGLAVILGVITTLTFITHLLLSRWLAKNEEAIETLIDRIKEHTSASSAPMTRVEETVAERISQQH